MLDTIMELKWMYLSGNQIFAFSGDQGQAARFKIVASHENINTNPFAINYPLSLSNAMVQSFGLTGIAADKIGVNTVVAYPYNNAHQCCVFEGAIQPRLLDANHYYVALGSGKTSADPFLRFLDDIFCQRVQPKVKDALFLSVWTIQHVIDTTFGLVDGPIRVVVMERNGTGALEARLLSPAKSVSTNKLLKLRLLHCAIGESDWNRELQPEERRLCPSRPLPHN
jgi:hypothetical protein